MICLFTHRQDQFIFSTESFTDFVGKLNWFGSVLGSNAAPTASKNDAQLESGQNQLEKNHLTSLI